jgi:hypothetical protein
VSPRCSNSHDRDEVCGDCDPTRRRTERPDPPQPPASRERGLEHARQIREQLAHIEGPPAITDTDTDDSEELSS